MIDRLTGRIQKALKMSFKEFSGGKTRKQGRKGRGDRRVPGYA